MKYAIGVADLMTMENIVYIIEAKDKIEAIKKAYLENFEDDESRTDGKTFLNNSEVSSVEDEKELIFIISEQDILISNAIEI